MNTVEYAKLEKKANMLRREKKYPEAIQLYKKIWIEKPTGYSGAGLINCYRCTNTEIDFALHIAEVLKNNNFFNVIWARNEYVLLNIKVKLNKEVIRSDFNKAIKLALELLNITKDPIQINHICMPILLVAKDLKKWNVVKQFISRVCVEKLTEITYSKNEWSQKSLYYNIYFKYLLQEKKTKMVLDQIDQYIDEFPRLAIYFLHHKAKAYAIDKEYENALTIYKKIEVNNPVSYIFYEIGIIYYRLDELDDSLKYLCKAAKSRNKPKNKVKVFLGLAQFFDKKQELKYAYFHFDLYIHIKQKNNWKISKKIVDRKLSIQDNLELEHYKSNYKSALYECKKIWNKYDTILEKRDKLFKGKISLKPNKPYGFINTIKGESYFVSRNNLSDDINDKCIVTFNIKPKFNKKRNEKSWEAINVQKKGVK